ncbi:MAG: CPBP family intramembrane glutamic endopeptidase [Kofleriaceae bacterium]
MTAVAGVGAFAAAFASFLVLASVLGGGRIAVVVAAMLALGLGALVGGQAIGLAPTDPGLRRPRPGVVLGAVILGATWWYLNLALTEPLTTALRDAGELDGLRARMVVDVPLAVTLLTAALVPAVCEELACRGLLVGALRRGAPPAVTVLVSAGLFAALHLSLMRAAPTFLLGALLASLRLRTGEVWSAMLVHLLNNTVALCALAMPEAAWVRWIGAHPGAALGVAVIGAMTGSALIVHATARADGADSV